MQTNCFHRVLAFKNVVTEIFKDSQLPSTGLVCKKLGQRYSSSIKTNQAAGGLVTTNLITFVNQFELKTNLEFALKYWV